MNYSVRKQVSIIGFRLHYLIQISPIWIIAGTLAFAQSTSTDTVQGIVTDSKGDALTGVNVLLKGANRGATSDASDRYTIAVPASGATLVFSFLGCQSQKIAVNNYITVNSTMTEINQLLDEVIVTRVFDKWTKRESSVAISTTNARQIAPLANLFGYIVWSGWYNVEWVAGYTKRLGIIYVNFATQEWTRSRVL